MDGLPHLLHLKHRPPNPCDFDFNMDVAVFSVDFPEGVVHFDFALAVLYRLVQVKNPPDVLRTAFVEQGLVGFQGEFFAVKPPCGNRKHGKYGKQQHLHIDAQHRKQPNQQAGYKAGYRQPHEKEAGGQHFENQQYKSEHPPVPEFKHRLNHRLPLLGHRFFCQFGDTAQCADDVTCFQRHKDDFAVPRRGHFF